MYHHSDKNLKNSLTKADLFLLLAGTEKCVFTSWGFQFHPFKRLSSDRSLLHFIPKPELCKRNPGIKRMVCAGARVMVEAGSRIEICTPTYIAITRKSRLFLKPHAKDLKFKSMFSMVNLSRAATILISLVYLNSTKQKITQPQVVTVTRTPSFAGMSFHRQPVHDNLWILFNFLPIVGNERVHFDWA